MVVPAYRPQKIHMATGTLADQVTYPVHIKPKNRTPEVESKLQELLDLVGVGYLVTRWAGDVVGKKRAEHKGWDHETKWDDVLSKHFSLSCHCMESRNNITASAHTHMLYRSR